MNSKLRKAIAEQEKINAAKSASKVIYGKYKAKEDLLLNFQMVRAYYGDNGASIKRLIDKILAEKYNLPWQRKIIRNALRVMDNQRNALISIPQFKFEEHVYDILSKFVKKNFTKMIRDAKLQGSESLYPLSLRTMLNSYS
jgi:hypothetical protein